jgi:hypothetical protein
VGGIVLVQREMECGRSPLVSIARASAGRVARPNVTVTGTRKRRTETATGFERRSGWLIPFTTERQSTPENQLATKKDIESGPRQELPIEPSIQRPQERDETLLFDNRET